MIIDMTNGFLFPLKSLAFLLVRTIGTNSGFNMKFEPSFIEQKVSTRAADRAPVFESVAVISNAPGPDSTR